MDPFQQFATWDEQTALGWATGLDQRASDPQQVGIRAGIVAAARLRPGQAAVEVGCGTGPLLAGLADAVGPTGRVLGVEPQPTLARIAARRLAERATVCLGTGAALPVRSGVADVAVAQTVLLHVPRAALSRTLAEMVRVVRPGGRVISVDQDMDSWLVDHPDRDTTTRLLRQNTVHRYGEGWAGRRMPALFRAAGLRDIDVVATTHIDTVRDSHLHNNLLRMLAEQVAAGLVAERDADRWRDQLAAQPHFFSSLTYYRCIGTVPA
jgi:ubiquinone/menaquinone biosynthesis C-methylase UbiE